LPCIGEDFDADPPGGDGADGDGVVVEGVGLVVDGVVAVDVGELPDWVLVLELVPGAAAAPAMPASAPPPASAPATSVAPRVLCMCIGSNLLGSVGCLSRRSSSPLLSGPVGAPKRINRSR
jgi:hypothetical protein